MNLQYMKMQILELGILILAAYVGGLIARKLKIGAVIGQIFGGILVGPHFLELCHTLLSNHPSLSRIIIFKPIYFFYSHGFEEYREILEGYHFFVFLFLGLIAFSIGEELHRERLKQVGSKALIICLIQGLLTFLLIASGFRFIFKFNWINSLIIGSIGIATAPALTFILMSKLKITGRLKQLLANIVVLDDILEVIFFSIFLSIAMAQQSGEFVSGFHIVREVAWELFLAAFIGFVIFVILRLAIKERKHVAEDEEEDATFLSTVLTQHPTPSVEILLIVLAIVAIGIAVAINFNLPFLITAVTAGFLISNLHNNAIFDSLKIENVMPIMNLLFFAIIGASVRLESFSSETIIYVLGYVILRSSGKIIGNWGGAKITDQDPKITAALPKLMLPQAGMAAVETILVASVLKTDGNLIFNTIIPALVIFELGGAYLSEKTLTRWKNVSMGEKEALTTRPDNKHPQGLSGLINDRITMMMATTRQEALFELAQLMVKKGIISETSDITNALLQREKLASTGIGRGIAIPHCRIPHIQKTTIACGILKHPIDWNSADKLPVETLFLILTPEEYPQEHLKAISLIASVVKKEHFVKELRDAVLMKNAEKCQQVLSIVS
ncbi:MAG: PTS sugar transporter subunit IIA [Candidatus Cloacimonetes bacterium]|nr:PTS sugar transporter subunit IIA [Candidatus Cloacimonadota bacterium]